MQSQRLALKGPPVRKASWICSQCRVLTKRTQHTYDGSMGSSLPSPVNFRGTRPRVISTTFSFIDHQRRWITKNHLRNIVTAEDDWQKRSEDIRKGDKYSILEILEQRGFVNQIVGTRDEFKKLLDNRRVGVYCGIDPTASSMHVGHMVPFMALSWMFIHGYSVKFLLGGSTARIGDPEGRLTARGEMSRVERNANIALMHTQLKRFGELMERYAGRRGYVREWAWRRELINNNIWHSKLSWFELMNTMGRHVRLGPMLGRDSVKNRMEHGDGMSFSEFAYPMIQAWDWWHMFKTGTQVQIGGADQFGNILQGAEAVKAAARNDPEWRQRMDAHFKNEQERNKVEVSEDPMGFTVPLLTTASGEKFGKSAGNAVWLDSNMTTVFELYQFWLRTADADVEKYLKLFTFLSLKDIAAVMTEHRKDESKRVAQHKLAAEFTELIHGHGAAQQAETEHRALFSKNMSLDEILSYSPPKRAAADQVVESPASLVKNASPQDVAKYGTIKILLPRSAVIEKPMAHVLWAAGMVTSKSEGQRLINSKGAYVGGKADSTQLAEHGSVSYCTIKNSGWDWWKQFLIEEKLLILRVGKWRIKIIDVVPDEEFLQMGLSCPGFNELVAGGQDGIDGPTLNRRDLGSEIATDDIDETADGGWSQIPSLKTSRKTQMHLKNAGKEFSPALRGHGRSTSRGSSRQPRPFGDGRH